MFRDFHVIEDEETDILFFPTTYRLFRLPKAQGQALRAYLAGETNGWPNDSGPLGETLAEEAAKASATAPRNSAWGATESLCLYVAQDCNLRCTYCYNHQGQAGQQGPAMMTAEVAEAAFRRFFVTPGKRYGVAFYGGEPLLNFRGMQAIVARGRALEAERQIEIVFSLTTNGTLINREIEAFLKAEIASITVSLDGPAPIHDRHRTGPKGGSHAKVLATLARLGAQGEGGPRLTLKGTLVGEGVADYPASLAHLHQQGARHGVLAPVKMSRDPAVTLTDEDYDRYLAHEAARCGAAVAGGMGAGEALPDIALAVVGNLLTGRKLRRHCQAGRDLAVAADGTLYACHGLTGQPEFAMGSVTAPAPAGFAQTRQQFAGLEVDQLPTCRACWARYFCGGACPAQSHFISGQLTEPDPRHCLWARRCSETVIRAFLAATARADLRQTLYANMRRRLGAPGGAAPAHA